MKVVKAWLEVNHYVSLQASHSTVATSSVVAMKVSQLDGIPRHALADAS